MEFAADDRVTIAESVTLHVRRWGTNTSGRPFVLVHGLSSNARLWDGVASILAGAGHPVTAVDLRSHGESDAPPTGYDTATAAADVIALARALAISDAVIAGQSWGGNVVVQVAARDAAQAGGFVAGLALVDGGWAEMSAVFRSWDECERLLRPPDIDGRPAEELRGYIRADHPGWSEAAIEATLANLRIGADGTVTRRLSIPHHMQIVRSMWDDPPLRYYPDIDVPVLLMPATPGPENTITDDNPDRVRQREARREQIAHAAQSLRDAEIHEYPGDDHDLHAQHPDLVAADLLALAKRIR